MEILSISLWVYFAEVVVSLLLVGFVIFLGKQLTKTNRRIVGTASPRRTYFEIGILNLAILFPNMYLIALSVIDEANSGATLQVNPLTVLFFALSFIGIPFWAAVRLTIPRETTPQAYIAAYRRSTIGLTLTVFGTSAFSYVLLPPLLLRLLEPRVSYTLGIDLLILTLTATLEFLLIFILLRGFMELVRFALSRRFEPKLQHQVPQRTHYYHSLTLMSGIVLALLLWATAYVLYINRTSHPNWTYIPPIYSNSLVPSTPQSPVDRSPLMMAAIALPPIAILFIGLLVTRSLFLINENAALMFATLSLLYGIWGLDVFPRFGGVFFWVLHLLSWLFITPVQLHFALVFPYEDENLPEDKSAASDMQQNWAWVKRALYLGFALMIPLWIFFHLITYPESVTLTQRYGFLIPLWGLWGIFGALSVTSTWLLSAYILWHTWRGLGKALETSQPLKSLGCTWQDIMEGVKQREYRIATGKQQLKWVIFGGVLASIFFVIWTLLLFPVIVPNSDRGIGWSDFAIKSVFLIIFGSVFFAIRQNRLWDVDRILVDASLWSLLTAALGALYVFLESALESRLDRTLGFIALFIMAKVSLDRWLSPWIYRLFWKEHYTWQQKIKEIGGQLRSPRDRSPTLKGAIQVLNDVCPEKASAAWLLASVGMPGERKYTIHNIHHDVSCQGRCRQILSRYLNGEAKPNQVVLTGYLYDRLMRAVSGNSIEVLALDRLVKEINLRFSFLRRDEPEPDGEQAVNSLQEANIAMLIPFGNKDQLKGVFIIASDGRGNHYDEYDLGALAYFADQFSVWLK